MPKKKITEDFDEFDDDFGFSTVDTEELLSYNEPMIKEREAEVEEAYRRLDAMHKAVLNLLKNLSKNPQQELIKWPNRVQKIDEFKLKLDRIRKGEE